MITHAHTSKRLFTIGHSDHEAAAFVALLVRHEITAVADVRSSPYSRLHGQFNRETLAAILKKSGIQYVFMGRELGARRTERETYEGKQARYERIARLPVFLEGIERLRQGVAKERIALLCAEKDPLTCHRTILVCRQLRQEPIEIAHILETGELETMEEAETRLLELVDLPATSLFQDREQLVQEAYDLQGSRIAFTESEDAEAGLRP